MMMVVMVVMSRMVTAALIIVLQDFGRQVDSVSSAHFVVESEMLWYIDQLHHGNM